MKKLMTMSAVAFLLAACGGDTLSKSQVQKAIKQQPVCIPFNLNVKDNNPGDMTQIGQPDILLLKRLPNGKRANLEAAEQMDVLVNAGIYRQEKNVLVGEGEDTIRFLAYSLTDKGRETFVPTPHGNLLCVGNEAVERVNFFTEPTPANGITISQVSYEAKLVPERWAKKLLKLQPNIFDPKHTITKHATLVKTNDGWRDIKDLRGR